MKKKVIISSLLVTTLPFSMPLMSQIVSPGNGNPTVPKPAPSSAQNSNNNSTNTTYKQAPKQSASPFGQEIPVFDPSNETYEFMGHKYSLADSRLLGQYEGYLASTTLSSKEAAAYRATIRKILNTVSPRNKKMAGKSKLKAGYNLLEDAAKYPGDGRICESLGNAIVIALNARNVEGKNDKESIALIEEKERILRKMKIMEESTDLGGTSSTPGKSGQPNNGQNQRRVTSSEYINFTKRIVEIEASIKKMNAENTVSKTLAKVQYQALLMQLFMQRRFEHVVMGCRFYNLIFTEGDSKLRIKKNSDLDKLFSKSFGVNPTIAGLDSIANESITKVNNLIDAFRNNLRMNQTHSAAQRLVEAYFMGEYMPSVQTISTEEKLKVQKYMLDSKKLVSAIDAKNMDLAKEMNVSLKSQADDYNYAKVDSVIQAYITASDSHVNGCYKAIASQSDDAYQFHLAEATKYWPGNPRIKELNNRQQRQIEIGLNKLDKLKNARDAFDQMLKLELYDKIMEEEHAVLFAAVFGQSTEEQDKQRLTKFKEIKNSIIAITHAIEKSNAQLDQGLKEAAWETLKIARDRYYDHKGISQRLTSLNSKVPEFIKLINQGESQLKGGNLGSALSYYLQARELHPTSKFAKEGIRRITDHKLKGKSLSKATHGEQAGG